MKDDLQQFTTSIKDSTTIFDGRQPLIEDELIFKGNPSLPWLIPHFCQAQPKSQSIQADIATKLNSNQPATHSGKYNTNGIWVLKTNELHCNRIGYVLAL